MTVAEFSKNKQSNIVSLTIGLISAVVLNISFWYVASEMIGIVYGVAMVVMSILFPVCVYAISANRIFGKYIYFYISMLVAVCLLLKYEYFSNVILSYINVIASAVNSENGLVIIPFATVENDNSIYIAQGMLILISSTVLVSGLNSKKSMIPIAVTAIPLIAGMCFGLVPNALPFAVYLFCGAIYILMCFINTGDSVKSILGIGLQLVFAVLIFFSGFSFVFANYDGSATVSKIRDGIDGTISSWRYDADLRVDVMPKGDLNKATELSTKGDVVFNISMENPSALYLRNYTGEQFHDGAWNELPKSSYAGKYLGISEWLSADGFYPISQLSALYLMESKRTGSAARISTVKIENISESSDKIFTPYEVVLDETLRDNNITDKYVKSNGLFGERSYVLQSYGAVYDYASYDMKSWINNLQNADGYDEYINDEKIYRAFVYDNYLDIDDEYYEMLCNLKIDDLKGKKLSDAVCEIRSRFLKEYTYSENLKADSKIDPIVNFAENTKTGYEPHFASLSALIYRYLGFPTRYVEGYAVTELEMQAYSEVKDMDFELYDTAAHAWVEVYVETVGWVPIEMTPGYYVLDVVEGETSSSVQESFSVKDETYLFEQGDVYETTAPSILSYMENFKDIVAIVCIAIVIIAIALNRFFAGRRKRRIAAAGDSATTIYNFKIVVKVIRLTGIDVQKSPYDAVASLGNEYKEYLDLVYKEAYSRDGLNLYERKIVGEYALKLIRQRYKESSIAGKIFLIILAYV